MKRLLAVTLGILTAIGGFVDIGDIVSTSEAGARFGLSHTWVLVVGVVGICVYAEMAGRVAAVSTRPVFDLVRERLGPRVALVNLVGSYLITVATLGAEIGGVALALQLLNGAPYLFWVPLVAVLLWLALWRVRFETLERVFGLAGLDADRGARLGLSRCDPDLGERHATSPRRAGENWPTYWFFAIALFASAMTPYEVFFFSSGGVEERWTARDLTSRGSTSSSASRSAGCSPSGSWRPRRRSSTRSACGSTRSARRCCRPGSRYGQIGLALAIIGVFAATFGAAMETSLSAGYTVAQYFGWPWGKLLRPRQATRFHTVVLVSILVARRGAADHDRPDPAHRVHADLQRHRPAADLPADPRRRQRPRLSRRQGQRPARQRAGPDLPGDRRGRARSRRSR